MRRVLAYLTWKAGWWKEQGERRAGISEILSRGLKAYADKQAYIHKSLARKFAAMWHGVHNDNGIPIGWPASLLVAMTVSDASDAEILDADMSDAGSAGENGLDDNNWY
jgi:hypothetical protein